MPEGTKVAKCVKDVQKKGKGKVSAIKICQTSTGQSYATGKPSKAAAARKKAATRKNGK